MSSQQSQKQVQGSKPTQGVEESQTDTAKAAVGALRIDDLPANSSTTAKGNSLPKLGLGIRG